MRSFTTDLARRNFGEVLRAARDAPVEISRHGKPAAVLLSPRAYAEFERLKDFALKRQLLFSLEAAIDTLSAGDSAGGLSQLRALAPLWRAVGVKGPKRVR